VVDQPKARSHLAGILISAARQALLKDTVASAIIGHDRSHGRAPGICWQVLPGE